MKNLEKQNFEKAWSEVFDQAEQTPSEKVWSGVESGLYLAEKVTLKRRVVFYQRMAAATILFALVMAGVTTFFISDSLHESRLVQVVNTPVENSEGVKPQSEKSNRIDGDSQTSLQSIQESESIKNDPKDAGNSGILSRSNEFIAAVEAKQADVIFNEKNYAENSGLIFPTLNNQNVKWISFSDVYAEPEVGIRNKMREVTIVRKLPAMPSVFMASKKSSNDKNENMWAAMGVSAGNYSPSVSLSSGPSASSFYQNQTSTSGMQTTGRSSSSSRGSAFSVGMNFGKRISKRWQLQTGLTYLTQSIGYTSNFAAINSNNMESYPAVADYAQKTSNLSMVSVSNPYQINSLNQFISVPLQAGYVIVNQKLGVQLNSGVATDFFLQNTLSDKSGQLSTFSTTAGEDSPFRTVTWAGLLGTEFSYKVGTSYRFSLVPGMRYSLNSIMKSDAVSANPLVWDIGFRCRYIFK